MLPPIIATVKIPRKAIAKAIYSAITTAFTCDEEMEREAMGIAGWLIRYSKESGAQILDATVYPYGEEGLHMAPLVIVRGFTHGRTWRGAHYLPSDWVAFVANKEPAA